MRALLFVLLVIPLGLFAQQQVEDIEPSAELEPSPELEPSAGLEPPVAIKPTAKMKPPAAISPATPIAPIPKAEAVGDIDFKPSEEISEDFPVALPSDI